MSGFTLGHTHPLVACREAPPGTRIEKAEGGFKVTVPGKDPVFFRTDQLRDSQDAKWHPCILPGGTPICLFAPSGA